MNLNNNKKWDEVYRSNKPNKIPWNFKVVPNWFKDIIYSNWVKPCYTLDIGCGLGNYAHFLSKNKFKVLSIDISKEAIKKAKFIYENKNTKFIVFDALKLSKLPIFKKFNFILDISFFHYVEPQKRKNYSNSLYKITNKKAKVLICCFNRKDKVFRDQKCFFNPDINMKTYTLSKKEIIDTFKEKFKIEEIKEIKFGKFSKIGNSLTRKRFLIKLERK